MGTNMTTSAEQSAFCSSRSARHASARRLRPSSLPARRRGGGAAGPAQRRTTLPTQRSSASGSSGNGAGGSADGRIGDTGTATVKVGEAGPATATTPGGPRLEPGPQQGVGARDAPAGAAVAAAAGSAANGGAEHAREVDRVLLVRQETLKPAASFAEAIAMLRAAVDGSVARYGALPSGLLRLEVPIPRGSTALHWLQGQAAASSSSPPSPPPSSPSSMPATASSATPPNAGAASNSGVLQRGRQEEEEEAAQQQQQEVSEQQGREGGCHLAYPRFYFSPRRSPAPDTPGGQIAEAAARGNGAVAGVGAAWLWKGAPGRQLDESSLASMRRFLDASCPRVRLFGGARFNQRQAPAPEWREFGSYLMVLPRLEMTESSGCALLAATLAWDAQADLAGGRGRKTLRQAAEDCHAALAAMAPPAAPSAPAFRLSRPPPQGDTASSSSGSSPAAQPNGASASGGSGRGTAAAGTAGGRHTPDERGWHESINQVLGSLASAGTDDAPGGGGADGWHGGAGDGDCGFDAVGDSCAAVGLGPQGAELVAREWQYGGQEGLDELLRVLDGGTQDWGDTASEDGVLTKVVVARATDLALASNGGGNGAGGGGGSGTGGGGLDPLALLSTLQQRDPRAYQLALTLESGATFLSSTPEQLYVRSGTRVASEAVAGTRARAAPGDVQKDFWLSLDLLRSRKDHREFTVVRDWVRDALRTVCSSVVVEREKSVLKQGSLQHLYGRLAGTLHPGATDAHLLEALHPTPAVCGRPRQLAYATLEGLEAFDRGMYAGPFGWVSGGAAEFVVAIRSALVQPPQPLPPQQQQEHERAHDVAQQQQQHVRLFAGVGIVRGSDPSQEWAELDLKASQYHRLLAPRPSLADTPNVNMLWARLLVEEACRQGVTTFAVAPGSRSSALTAAAAMHPRAHVVVGIDERSLAYWALGNSRATGRPTAVLCSSGTAVANLLPAVVEACHSDVPLLLITADRPLELRDSGANQTIDQVKIFGGYVRWSADLDAPSDRLPARVAVTTIDTAVRHALGGGAQGGGARPGPVHINCQFREPLTPQEANWDRSAIQGLEQWEASDDPFTRLCLPGASPPLAPPPAHAPARPAASPALSSPLEPWLLRTLCGADRGLLVVGELHRPTDVAAAAQLAAALGWPTATDVLSGLRIGAPSGGLPPALDHFDHLLLEREGWPLLQPDVCVVVGQHLSSKRLGQFLEWAALEGGAGTGRSPTQILYVGPTPQRHDPSHTLTAHVQLPLPAFAQAVASAMDPLPTAALGGTRIGRDFRTDYGRLLHAMDEAAAEEVRSYLGSCPDLTEPAVAAMLAEQLPLGDGLFLGNSMPIRDMEMYGARRRRARDTPLSSSSSPPPSSSYPSPSAPRASPDARPGCAAAMAAAGVGAPSSPAYDDGAVSSSNIDSLAGGLGPSSSSIGSLGMQAGGGSSPPLQSPSTGGDGAGCDGGEGCSGGGSDALMQAEVDVAMGAPVASNRGASGIDGVLSAAAGYAAGLGRAVTLVVGDVSFLHDTNGLALLRQGEARPPLTVVLVNNGGGGIFSFLPIAGALPEDVFTQLWATPQNVDLAGLCRAHGVPHQRVASLSQLSPALHSAWSLNAHSVVEVITDREANVGHHQRLQSAVAAAVRRAAHACTTTPAAAAAAAAAFNSTSPLSHALARLDRGPVVAGAGGEPPRRAEPLPQMVIESLSWRRFSLPLARPLTTGAAGEWREGLLLRMAVHVGGQGGRVVVGLGECSTLPGLHSESLQEAQAQISALQVLLPRSPLPPSLALLRGRVSDWLWSEAGVRPEALLPSVRCALELAALDALATAKGCSLAQLLAGPVPLPQPQQQKAQPLQPQQQPGICALLPSCSSAEEALAAAQALAAAGACAIKVKVARPGRSPEDDAEMLAAVASGAGPSVALRADANRGWDGESALRFAAALAARRVRLESLEEPLAVDRGGGAVGGRAAAEALAEFSARTGLRVGVDETLDEACASGRLNESVLQPLEPHGPVLVAKPSVLGGVEAAREAGAWASRHGGRLVISSSFESGAGLAALREVAAAADVAWGSPPSTSSSSSAASSAPAAAAVEQGSAQQQQQHGLGTAAWFVDDLTRDQVLEGFAAGGGDPGSSNGVARAGSVDLSNSGGNGSDGNAAAHGSSSNGASSSSTQSSSGGVGGGGGDGGRPRAELGPVVHAPLPLQEYYRAVHTADGEYNFRVLDSRPPSAAAAAAVASPPPLPTVSSGSNGNGAYNGHGGGQPGGGQEEQQLPLLLLHGFMGDAGDWAPVAAALSCPASPSPSCNAGGGSGRRCVALDLPGHGSTEVLPPVGARPLGNTPIAISLASSPSSQQQQQDRLLASSGTVAAAAAAAAEAAAAADAGSYSVEAAADAVAELLRSQLGLTRVAVAGYSLGGRVALALAARHPSLVAGVACLSATPGIEPSSGGSLAAAGRAARDDALADSLVEGGADAFLRYWYQQPMWGPLRSHPRFGEVLERRVAAAAGKETKLAAALRGMSPGRQQPLWSALSSSDMPPVVVVAGQLDAKFVRIGKRMAERLQQQQQRRRRQVLNGGGEAGSSGNGGVRSGEGSASCMEVVPGCGHALLSEAPLEVARLVGRFADCLHPPTS